ncbi:SDR family NAD(P)-dependent oxidoreductase [Streptomyces sp. NBC_01497]|uniref:SDR family NAD(P)-dependent oxidoreductase n=1 Tax=Streptomyces sp. NBC_01497 TaxID=2903885 RepID=UPI002E37D9B7|nr:SDR family NAD(P)-dependent oxidoreductase [Streptomyces sp. NBC_01497]
MSLNGKVALVTGAGRGIGREVALALAERGVTSALVARSGHELSETARLVEGRGGKTLALVADLADPAALATTVDRAVSALGPIGILVNNAATVEPLGPSAGMDPTTWASSLGINVIAPASLAFALLPAMVQAGWGRIVNVSSIVVAHPAAMIGGNAYATTKAALEAHTANLAAELAGTGVTANTYRPGSVDTAMQELVRTKGSGRVSEETHARFVHNHEKKTLITPQRSALSLVARLTSDASGQIWDASDPL